MTNLWKAVAALGLAAGILALLLTTANVAAPPESPVARGACSTPLCFSGGNTLDVNSGGTINVNTGGALAIDAASGFTINGISVSGAVKFGTASNVISGTTIAHGIATTPTAFLVQNGVVQVGTFTQTIYGFACGTVSCTVGLSEGNVVTFTTVNWIAGK